MDILKFAIDMELEGEKYYIEQAEINKDNSLKNVFVMLAKDEEYHAGILKNKLDGASYELKDNDTSAESKNIFKGIGDYKNEIRDVPHQLDLYRAALEKEKQSIELYEDLLTEATDDDEKNLAQFLIKQERDHFEILEEMVIRINRPNDWVESAEFGIRKEEY